MTSTAVLAQVDSVANWVAAIGQVLGAIGTFAAVVVALRLARSERRQDAAERRDREATQARLVTIEVGYRDWIHQQLEDHMAWVTIANHSDQPVHQPRVESVGRAQPPVRWGLDQTTLDEYSLTEVLPARVNRRVPFEHFDADGRTIDSTSARNIEKWVEVDDVTITFTDTCGLRWRRTGNGEPVRVVQPAPAE